MDWTNKGGQSYLLPVKNQFTSVADGSFQPCYDNWLFAAMDTLEPARSVALGDPSYTVPLSAQQVLDCSPKPTNPAGTDGCVWYATNWEDGADYISNHGGLCRASEYAPYEAKQKACRLSTWPSCQLFQPVTSWVRQIFTADTLLAAVTQQPVLVTLIVDMTIFQYYKGGIITDTQSGCGSFLNVGVWGNDMSVVGYGTSNEIGGVPTDYWKLRNSWGTSWGESGYVRMGRADVPDPSGSIYHGVCGIYGSEGGYPVVPAV